MGNKYIILILLLAAGLRFSGITYDSLWLDESYQSLSEAVGQRLPDFLSCSDKAFLFKPGSIAPTGVMLSNFRTIDPLCPPLYAVVLNRWMALFGGSDFTVRSLSVLFSLCSLVALYAFARYAFGETIAETAALLMAVSPFDIYYAQETRMYEMLMFFSICSSFCLWLLIKRVIDVGKLQRLLLVCGYAFCVWAMVNSHYTGLFIACFQILFALAAVIYMRNIRLGLWFAISCVLVYILWQPWMEMFGSAALLRNASFYVSRVPSWWWPPWALLVRIPLNWIAFLSGKHVFVPAIGLYLTSAFLLVTGLRKALQVIRNSAAESDTIAAPIISPYAFLLSWLILPAVLIWTSDIIEGHRIVEISRYLIGTAPAACILAAVGLPGYPAGLSRSLAGLPRAALSRAAKIFLTVHVFFALINNAAAHTFPQREPWKDMALAVQRECSPDDLVVVSQYIDIVCLDRYLSRPQRQIGISPGLGSAEIAGRLAGVKRFWLLTAQEGDEAKNMLPARFVMGKEINMAHGLHLRLYTCMQ